MLPYSFRLTRSIYIGLIVKAGIYSKENIKHYIILTSENVIDVVALDEPAVTIIQGV